jgi:flagellar basal-body rod protein FlgB
MRLTSNEVEGIARSLDALSMRHQAIASNIANVNTPGYVQQEVNFEQSLIDALQESSPPASNVGLPESIDGMAITTSHPDVMLSWQPAMTRSSAGAQRVDGNHTSVETEMGGMAFNAVKYNALASVIAKEYSILKSVAQAK